MGSVSITSWQLACTGVLALLSDALVAAFSLAGASKQKTATPMPAKTKKPGTEGERTQTDGKKQEL